jgi:hypothetical protein
MPVESSQHPSSPLWQPHHQPYVSITLLPGVLDTFNQVTQEAEKQYKCLTGASVQGVAATHLNDGHLTRLTHQVRQVKYTRSIGTTSEWISIKNNLGNSS